MEMLAEVVKIDAERVAECLQAASAKLDPVNPEMVLDFSAVRRIDPKALRALEALAGLADAKAVRIGLRGVNVDVYKVFKLVKLTRRFGFLA